MEKKVTHGQPIGVIGSSSSEHQWVAGGSVRFETARKWWKNTNSAKISPDSMRFLQIQQKSYRIQWDFARSGQNLTGSKGNRAEIWKNITRIWVLSPDSGKFWPKSFGRFRFFGFFRRILEILVGIWKSFDQFGFFGFYGRKTETRLARLGFWWWRLAANPPKLLDPVGSSDGSGTWMNLDGPSLTLHTVHEVHATNPKKLGGSCSNFWVKSRANDNQFTNPSYEGCPINKLKKKKKKVMRAVYVICYWK